jgi:hypothetical protein
MFYKTFLIFIMLNSSLTFAGSSRPSFEQLKEKIVVTFRSPSDFTGFRVISITQQAGGTVPGEKLPFIFIACYYHTEIRQNEMMMGIVKFNPDFSLDAKDITLVAPGDESRPKLTTLCQ